MIKDATWRGISVRRAMSFVDLKKKKKKKITLT